LGRRIIYKSSIFSITLHSVVSPLINQVLARRAMLKLYFVARHPNRHLPDHWKKIAITNRIILDYVDAEVGYWKKVGLFYLSTVDNMDLCLKISGTVHREPRTQDTPVYHCKIINRRKMKAEFIQLDMYFSYKIYRTCRWFWVGKTRNLIKEEDMADRYLFLDASKCKNWRPLVPLLCFVNKDT